MTSFMEFMNSRFDIRAQATVTSSSRRSDCTLEKVSRHSTPINRLAFYWLFLATELQAVTLWSRIIDVWGSWILQAAG